MVAAPSAAQIVAVPPPRALSGETIVSPPPNADVVIYHVGLLGLINKARLAQIELKITPLTSPLVAGLERQDFKRLRLIESTNHIFGDSDDIELNKVKSQDIVLDGGVTVITDKGNATPVGLFPLPVGVLLRHYFVVAEIAANATAGHAFRVGAALGHITVSTPGTIGLPLWPSNTNRVVIGGLLPKIDLRMASLDFGTVTVGQDSVNAVRIGNLGAAGLVLTSVSSDDGDFSGSPTGLTVSPGDSASVSVTYAPSTAGARAATLSLVHNDPNSPTQISLTGSGASTTPQVAVAPNSLDFGNLEIGDRDTLVLAISNTGSVAAQISGIAINDGQFSASPAMFTLAAGVRQAVEVIFAPITGGASAATLDVAVTGLSSPVNASLTGLGLNPGLVSSVGSIVFGNIRFDVVGETRITLTNASDAAISITNITSSDAQFSTSVTSLLLAPGQTRPVTIYFSALSLGTKRATLSIQHDGAVEAMVLPLRADATVALDDSRLDFGAIAPGETAWLPVRIDNPSSAPVTITSIVSDNALFVPELSTCVIPAGGSHEVLIAFRPTDTTRQTANLSITHNPTLTVTLVGNDFGGGSSPALDASGQPLKTLQVPFGGEALAALLVCLYAMRRRRCP